MTQIPNVGPVIHAAGAGGGNGSSAENGEEAAGFEGILGGMLASQTMPAGAPVQTDPGGEAGQVAESDASNATITTEAAQAEGASSTEANAGEGVNSETVGSTEGAEHAPSGEVEVEDQAASGTGEEGAAVAEGQEAQVLASVLAAAAQIDAQEVLNVETQAGLEGIASEGVLEEATPAMGTVNADAEAPAGAPVQPETEGPVAGQAHEAMPAPSGNAPAVELAQVTGGEAGERPVEVDAQQLVSQAPQQADPTVQKTAGGDAVAVPHEQAHSNEIASQLAELGGEVVSTPAEGNAPTEATAAVQSTEEPAAKTETGAESSVQAEAVLETPDRGEMGEAQEMQIEASTQVAEEEVERSARPEVVRASSEQPSEVSSKQVPNQQGEAKEVAPQEGAESEITTEVRSAGNQTVDAGDGDEVPQASEVADQPVTTESRERVEVASQSEQNAGAVKVEAGEAVALDRPAEAQMQEAAAAEKAGQTPVRTAELEPQRGQIMDQVVRSAKLNLDANNSRFELRLQPPELGRMGVVMDLKDGALSVSFRVENEAVRELLQGSMAQLRTALSEGGVTVDGLDVQSSGPQAGEQQATGNDSGAGSESRGGGGAEMDMSEEPVASGAGETSGSSALDYWA